MSIESLNGNQLSQMNYGTTATSIDSDRVYKINDRAMLDPKLLTPQEKNSLPVADKFLVDSIEKANKAIINSGRKFEYSIHDKTKQIVIKVLDANTNEVIREIPSEKILNMVATMCELAGIFLDEKR